MSWTCRRIAAGLLLIAPALLAQNLVTPTSRPTTTRHHKSHKTVKPLVLPPLPPGPLSQLPMDQLPPAPAKVSYQGGLLTIAAQNSTLGEILRDVRKLTGASIDIPPGGATERVVAYLGPGAPRDVLAGLLNGSAFNYVMLGSSSDPTSVVSVLLTPKPTAPGETQTAANVAANVYENQAAMPNRFPQPMPYQRQVIGMPPNTGQPGAAQPSTDGDDEKSADEEDSTDENADDQAQAQPGQPGQPDVAGANVQEPQQTDPSQPNAGPKTPEQILEMLRRQQPGTQVIPPPQPPQQQ